MMTEKLASVFKLTNFEIYFFQTSVFAKFLFGMLQQFFIGILLFLTSFESSTIAKSCEESAKFVVYQNS